MKTYVLSAFIFLSATLSLSCSKSDCGCAPPPVSDGYWKITSRQGGFGGGTVALTSAQENTVLTLKTDGKYICTNQQTGETVNGDFSIESNFSSIYGEKPRFIFNPALPMLNNQFYVLLENPKGKLVLGDNLADGYSTTFSVTQP